jgi:uncharacterized repeat protein (TIGR01451 family)
VGTSRLRPGRKSARVAVLLVAAAAVCASVTLGSTAAASRQFVTRGHPGIVIVSSPKSQTLETTILAKVNPKTHARTPRLVLGTAKFTITVTNADRVELTGVTVADPLSPRCNRNVVTLAAGASVAYACSAANVGRNYTNTVTVSGQRPNGARAMVGAQATATATALVKVKKPKTKVVHALTLPFTG